MFDVGFQEIVLISVIALIVIGPEKLPAAARSVGLWVGKIQRFVAGVKSDIQSELKTDELRSLLNSQEDQIRELKEMVNETRSDIERTAQTASKSLSEGMDGAVEQVRDAADAARENNAKMQAIADAAGHGYDGVGSTDSGESATEQPAGSSPAAEKPASESSTSVDQDASKSA